MMKKWMPCLLLVAMMLAMSSCEPMPRAGAEPVSMPEACLQGCDYGGRDARSRMPSDPYRYRGEVSSQNWSDFVDGYLHGYARAGGR